MDGPLPVPGLGTIPGADLEWRYTTSGGPGGQHANRSRTRVELRWDLTKADLTTTQRERLVRRFGDIVVVVADDERSQSRNRALARSRLAERVAAALVVPRRRVGTKPGRGARQRRLDKKRQTSDKKKSRSWRPD